MRSILTLALAGAIAITAFSPVSAATRHKRTQAPAQTEYSDQALQQSPVAARPGIPAVVYDQPFACFTDEGYGRFASCDQGGY